MNYYVEASTSIGFGYRGFHWEGGNCPLEGTTPVEHRRIPIPWLCDVPPQTKDYLWDTDGWENDCLHIKVLSQPIKPYGENTAMPYYGQVVGNYWRDWLAFRFTLGEEEVIAEAVTGSVWNSSSFRPTRYARGILTRGGGTTVIYRWYQYTIQSYDGPIRLTTPTVAFNYVDPTRATLQRMGSTNAISVADKLLYRQPLNLLTDALFQEEASVIDPTTTYRMTAHSLKMSTSNKLGKVLAEPCAAAYYDAISNADVRACDNALANIAELLVLACGILSVKKVLQASKSTVLGSLGDNVNQAVSNLLGLEQRTSLYRYARVIGFNGATSKVLYKAATETAVNGRKAAKAIVNTACAGWLGYRYAYSTTVQDCNQALRYVKKQLNEQLQGYEKPLRSYGQKHFTAATGEDCLVRCRIEYRPRTLTDFATRMRDVWKAGLEPNLYVLWDIIPFSFIADWFVPIGDMAEVLSNKWHLEFDIAIGNICYSLEYNYQTPSDALLNRYIRWHGEGYPVESIVKGMQLSTTASRTAFRRINDVVSLSLGGK